MNKEKAINGLLVIDKPLRMTSRDALNKAWRWLPRGTRIGHTGTLDPLATGVLVVCAGVATRLAEYVQRLEKVYRAGIRLGARSTTDDAEGTITPAESATPPERPVVEQALQEFLGAIAQVPPDHSAAKVTGRRAYDLARQGKEVELAPRQVTIHEIDVHAYRYPTLELEIRCGKGTYIRALARDLGERLGCGAYLQSLRRTRVGRFGEAQALSLDTDHEMALAHVLPLVEAVRELPTLVVEGQNVVRLQTGQGLPSPETFEDGQDVAMISVAGTLLAVGQVSAARGLILPQKVFFEQDR